MNALSAAFSYYLAAGRRVEEMEEDGRLQDVYIRTPELVLMARRVDSAAPFGKVVDVRFRFEPGRCDAWHLHFLAGDVRELLAYKREILSLPWILTQHGKRGDGRLVKLPASRVLPSAGSICGGRSVFLILLMKELPCGCLHGGSFMGIRRMEIRLLQRWLNFLYSFPGVFAGTSLNQGLCEPVCLIAAVQPSFAEHGELFARMVK